LKINSKSKQPILLETDTKSTPNEDKTIGLIFGKSGSFQEKKRKMIEKIMEFGLKVKIHTF
jgi:hypothetical protein